MSSEPIFHTVITNPEGARQQTELGKPPPDPGKPSLLQRPCMYLTCFVKSLPVIFISLIVCWSYYAYFVATVILIMTDMVEQVICGVIFHIITILFIWSYYMIVFTPPGSVPPSWRLSQTNVDMLAAAKSEEEWKSILTEVTSHLGCSVKQRSVQNAVRYCEKCLCIKPDRSHHCSVCEVCTLKMDHHCPWVNNCVGFANYKFFILFLGYSLTYCIFIGATTARHFITIWLLKDEDEDVDQSENSAAKYHLLFVFFVSLLFCLSICSLFGYHIWLVLHNRTTLEQFRAPMFENNLSEPNGWSLGKMNNLREVFGNNPFLWLFPVKTAIGDGLSYPSRTQGDIPSYQDAETCAAVPSVYIHEGPSRTLINPTVGGQLSVTLTSNQPPVTSETSASMVRLENNGYTKTVMLDHSDLTQLSVHR